MLRSGTFRLAFVAIFSILSIVALSSARAQIPGEVLVHPQVPTAGIPFHVDLGANFCFFQILRGGEHGPRVAILGKQITVTIAYLFTFVQPCPAVGYWVPLAMPPLPAGDYELRLVATGYELPLNADADFDHPVGPTTWTTHFTVRERVPSTPTMVPTMSPLVILMLAGAILVLGFFAFREKWTRRH